jgi:hypothetical protein
VIAAMGGRLRVHRNGRVHARARDRGNLSCRSNSLWQLPHQMSPTPEWLNKGTSTVRALFTPKLFVLPVRPPVSCVAGQL